MNSIRVLAVTGLVGLFSTIALAEEPIKILNIMVNNVMSSPNATIAMAQTNPGKQGYPTITVKVLGSVPIKSGKMVLNSTTANLPVRPTNKKVVEGGNIPIRPPMSKSSPAVVHKATITVTDTDNHTATVVFNVKVSCGIPSGCSF